MIKGIKPKLAETGKIKIGGLGAERKSGKGNTYRLPQKLDHFLITSTIRDENGDLAQDALLMSEITTDPDGKIRSIPIILHSDEIDEVFPTSYALYSSRKCICRGDGESAVKRQVETIGKGAKASKAYTGKQKTIECPCEYLNAEKEPKCKPNGKLFCSIDVPGASVAGAVHIWRTTSIISVEQMIGSLLQIKSICGTLRGIPLRLCVKPITVEPPGQGSITVYCCHVELRSSDIMSIQQRALEASEMRKRLGWDDSAYKTVLSLPGHNESDEEQAEIADEFYSENEAEIIDVTPKSTAETVRAELQREDVPPEIPPEMDEHPDDLI